MAVAAVVAAAAAAAHQEMPTFSPADAQTAAATSFHSAGHGANTRGKARAPVLVRTRLRGQGLRDHTVEERTRERRHVADASLPWPLSGGDRPATP